MLQHSPPRVNILAAVGARMLFSSQLPLTNVIDLCRALRHNLGAGLSLVRVLRQQAERGPAAVRPLATRMAQRLQEGDSLSVTLDQEKDHLPPLFLSLAKVGEETGHLPEIFGELERYYLLQQKLRRDFRSQSLLPIVQFFLALLLVAGLIFVLGMIAAARGGTPLTLFGLSGPSGALIFLAVSFGALALMWLGYGILRNLMDQQAAVDAVVLRLPALGPCLEALVLSRFCLAMYLTLDSGMSITRAVRLSLEATGNGAFAAKSDGIVQSLKNGEPLLEALTASGLFSAEFLQLVATGEEGGRVPEVLRHQAEYYQEEAERRLKTFTRLASLAVWFIYAAFMVVMIFRIASFYMSALGV